MANYETLKTGIRQVIKENGNREITGELMQQTLLAMVNSLGCSGYQYAGIADPSTDPGTPDQRVFYIAPTYGHYTHFGNLVVQHNEVAILKFDSVWTKDTTGIAQKEQLTNIVNRVANVQQQSFMPDINQELKGGIEVDQNKASFCIKNQDTGENLATIEINKYGGITIIPNGNRTLFVDGRMNVDGDSEFYSNLSCVALSVNGVGDVKDMFDELTEKTSGFNADGTTLEKNVEDYTDPDDEKFGLYFTPDFVRLARMGQLQYFGGVQINADSSVKIEGYGLKFENRTGWPIEFVNDLKINTGTPAKTMEVGKKIAELEARIAALEARI